MAHVTRERYEALPFYTEYPPKGSKCGAVVSEAFRSPVSEKYNENETRPNIVWVDKCVASDPSTGEGWTELRPWTIITEGKSE